MKTKIKLEILKMARDLANDQFYFVNAHIQELIEKNPKRVTKKDLPKYVSPKDILIKANQFKKFMTK